MTTLEILTAAREKITDEKNWTQGANARSAKGYVVPTTSRHAICWCMNGAISAVAEKTGRDYFIAASRFYSLVRDFVEFNDTHTHPEVLALFDRAIESEREKETDAHS